MGRKLAYMSSFRSVNIERSRIFGWDRTEEELGPGKLAPGAEGTRPSRPRPGTHLGRTARLLPPLMGRKVLYLRTFRPINTLRRRRALLPGRPGPGRRPRRRSRGAR